MKIVSYKCKSAVGCGSNLHGYVQMWQLLLVLDCGRYGINIMYPPC